MKHICMKKLTLVIVFLLFLLCILLSGCAGRQVPTAEQFSSACENIGYTVTDSGESFDPSTVSTALTVSEEETGIGFFVFTTPESAKSNYAQMLSSIKTGASDEKYVDSAEYNRFYLSTDDGTTLLYRNGSTLFFASSTDKEKLARLIDALGV
ncbi:MAG: hypothetical protein ACI4GO_06440 [Hominenteromicrobium sp.]